MVLEYIDMFLITIRLSVFITNRELSLQVRAWTGRLGSRTTRGVKAQLRVRVVPTYYFARFGIVLSWFKLVQFSDHEYEAQMAVLACYGSWVCPIYK